MSDKTRRALFAEIMTGETDFERLVRKQRLVRVAAERALKDLEAQGLVAVDGSAPAARDPDDAGERGGSVRGGRKLGLTPAGETVARELKKQDLLS